MIQKLTQLRIMTFIKLQRCWLNTTPPVFASFLVPMAVVLLVINILSNIKALYNCILYLLNNIDYTNKPETSSLIIR